MLFNSSAFQKCWHGAGAGWAQKRSATARLMVWNPSKEGQQRRVFCEFSECSQLRLQACGSLLLPQGGAAKCRGRNERQSAKQSTEPPPLSQTHINQNMSVVVSPAAVIVTTINIHIENSTMGWLVLLGKAFRSSGALSHYRLQHPNEIGTIRYPFHRWESWGSEG